MPIHDSNRTDSFDNTVVVLEDGQAGNGKRVSVETKPNGKNAAHVIADLQVTSDGSIPTVGKYLRYVDMNASVGGVARNTTVTNAAWIKLYDYTGSGLMFSMVLNVEDKNNWLIRMVVDGEEVFSAAGFPTSDLVSDTAYDLDDAGSPLSPVEGNIGLSLEDHDRFVWVCPNSFPIRYESSVQIYVRRAAGQASKRFNAGLLVTTRQ